MRPNPLRGRGALGYVPSMNVLARCGVMAALALTQFAPASAGADDAKSTPDWVPAQFCWDYTATGTGGGCGKVLSYVAFGEAASVPVHKIVCRYRRTSPRRPSDIVRAAKGD